MFVYREAKLKNEWQEFTDEATGRVFWFNPATEQSTWDDPNAPPDPWQEHQVICNIYMWKRERERERRSWLLVSIKRHNSLHLSHFL